MIYAVQARLKSETAADFFRKLTDGTIESQHPDGSEIVASMKRAIIGEDGIVRWSETCYCPAPLQHERETVYHDHFVGLKIEEVENHIEFYGPSLMRYLEEEAQI